MRASPILLLATWFTLASVAASSAQDPAGRGPTSYPALPPNPPLPSPGDVRAAAPLEVLPPGPATPGGPQETQSLAALVVAGEAAFGKSCVACHAADQALAKRKTLPQWRATVERMAAKDGADVPAGDVAAIAAFLASLGGADVAAAELGAPPLPVSPIAIYGTVSPTWRGGSSDLQNPGFLPDVWAGLAVQATPALSARATACISCHTEAGEGSRLELVEAALHLDLQQALGRQGSPLRAAIDAGRFIVPFGAFAQQSNPGVYRTVTKPLIYNMGLRVFDGDLGDPVLPMPYSDEGANLNVSGLLWNDVVASWDTYVVNGLQGGADGIDFDLSRDYVDNNSQPAVGTRLTVGNSLLRLGSSLMTGNAAPTGGIGPAGDALNYRLYGFDAVFHYQDLFRFQFEYARRDSDRLVNTTTLTRDHVSGFYLEGELLLWRAAGLSLLARYDQQDRTSVAPPPESSLSTGTFAVTRYTYGLNWRLPGGSLLMIDYERWNLPTGLPRQDVIGVRWSYAF